MSVFKLPGTAIQANTITTTQLQTTVVTQISAGGGPKVKSLIYPGDDTAANSVGGQTVYITGSGFAANAQVLVNGSAVPSQSFISASNISFTTPALSTGTYPVYVINPEDGGTAILYPGLLISGEPTWTTSATLSDVDVEGAWSISLSATGDTPITYALAAGNTLPSGITLSANGLISGTLSSPPGSDTTYNFSVIATDAQNQDSTKQFSITATNRDAYFPYNALLIHANGTNNGNNHAFVESSNNNFSITRYGNATQGTFSPFSQTGWSAYFDGTGDYLSVPYTTTNFDWWTSDFTIEAWVFPTNLSNWQNANDPSMVGNLDPSSSTNYWSFGPMSNRTVRFKYWNGSSNNIDSTELITLNAWNHIAFTKTSSGCRVWVNGIGTTAVAVSGTPLSSTSYNLVIGQYDSKCINGYVSNLRIIKGAALYTSNFTPSTTPLTAVSNTKLLTLQSNRFIDNSTNSFTLTRNGEVSTQAFSPFAPTAAYSTANVGGSLYLDGSGDYLTLPTSSAFAPGTGDYTIEAWVYPTTTAGDQFIWAQSVYGTNYFIFAHSGTTAGITSGSGGGTFISGPANSIKPYAWNHIAAVRISGTLTVYVNGVGGTPTSHTNNFTDTTMVPTIGRYTHDSFGSFTGYISSLRYVKGTGVYTANFTPPTGPLTNIANTSALLNFTNAQIFDQTAKNVLECIGDAKVSTAQYKYGTASIALDGTGDWLVSPVSQNFDFGTGDFTIECWFRLNSLASNYYVIGGNYNAGASDEWLFQVQNNGSIRFLTSADSTFATPSPAITTNTWYHVAATRSGSTVRLFIDGTSIRSYTNANSLGSASKKVYWGIQANESSWPFNGYIDDIRITKGYARYTSNFTAPSSAHKDK